MSKCMVSSSWVCKFWSTFSLVNQLGQGTLWPGWRALQLSRQKFQWNLDPSNYSEWNEVSENVEFVRLCFRKMSNNLWMQAPFWTKFSAVTWLLAVNFYWMGALFWKYLPQIVFKFLSQLDLCQCEYLALAQFWRTKMQFRTLVCCFIRVLLPFFY